MLMMYRLPGLVLCLLLCSMAHGRLGESLEQLTHRFGQLSKIAGGIDVQRSLAGETRYAVKVGDINVVAGLINNRCEYIRYGKTKFPVISGDEQSTFFKSNGGNHAWVQLNDASQVVGTPDNSRGQTNFRRTDNLAFAARTHTELAFESKLYRDLRDAAAKQAAQQQAAEERARAIRKRQF